ncbi:MAG: ATP-binding protein [Prevotellaceae bacterium]|jgi:AAA+ ATPase superfamily predicted ATPase|nr:ATP-binding protein [Prevotellaceae bacterium]
MSNLNQISSPFLFGKTVPDSVFINRKNDIEHLWLNLRSGINTVLISPRRWGKSSLVAQTAFLHRQDKPVKWCFFDMFAVRDEADFYAQFSRALLKATSSKWEDWVKGAKMFFKQLLPKITVGVDPAQEFSVSFDWKELENHKDEILNLPEQIAQKQQIQLIICIDEFQNIHYFPEAESFEKLLRSYWQHHQRVSYCLYGSKRTLMAEIFNKKNRAFYRFGDVMMLDKIATEHWIPFIVEKFAQTGKAITPALAEKIVALMKNHPYYVQQLSHYVWENTPETATADILEEAVARLLEVNYAMYQGEVEALSNTQVNLLKAIANGVTQLMALKTLQDYHIGTPRNVSKNIKILERDDFIEKVNKRAAFLDPAFELWFCRYYMHKSLNYYF